jgi:hypothetical protein
MLPGDRVEVLPGQPQQHRGLDGDDVDDRWLAADQRDLADVPALPASVVTTPVAVTLRIVELIESATKTLPALSTATPPIP